MGKESDDQKRSNMSIARTVYMYILIVGALALMSTDRFSFDVLEEKDPAWSTLVLFWLTIVMLSGAYYMFDRSIRKTRWFSLLMSGMFMVAVVYPFYTLSDPRMMIVRIGTGIVVMLAIHSLYRTVYKSVDTYSDLEDSKRVPDVPRPRNSPRGVNNFTRMRGPITDSRYALGDERFSNELTDDELVDSFNAMANESFIEQLIQNEEVDKEIQRIVDEAMSNRNKSRMVDRMARVRARRELPKRVTRIVRMSDLVRDDEPGDNLDIDRKDNEEE